MTHFDWTGLATKENRQARQALPDDAIQLAIEEELKNIQTSIGIIRSILLVQALKHTDAYYDLAKENRFTAEETMITPRIRQDARYGTPSFYWEKTVRHAYPLSVASATNKRPPNRTYEAYVRRKGQPSKEKMRVFLLSKHLPISKKTLSTSMNAFLNEPQWAQIAASIIEPKLTVLRRLSKAVNVLSRAQKQLLTLLSNGSFPQ